MLKCKSEYSFWRNKLDYAIRSIKKGIKENREDKYFDNYYDLLETSQDKLESMGKWKMHKEKN